MSQKMWATSDNTKLVVNRTLAAHDISHTICENITKTNTRSTENLAKTKK